MNERKRPEASRPRMAPIIGLAGLLVVVLGVVMLATGGRPVGTGGAPKLSSSPQLVVDRESIDLGRVPVEKMAKASFTLRNEGDQPLKIVGEPRVEAVKGC